MEVTLESAIAKIIFWQKVTLILLTIFLVIFWILIVNDIVLGLEYGYFYDYYTSTLWFIALCSLGTFINYLLYQSFKLLNSYQKNEDKVDLEISFRKQRYFWMSLPITLGVSILSLIVILFFTFLNLTNNG